MITFFDRLAERCRRADSLLCVGLDPHPEDLHPPGAPAARDFCLQLIEQTADQAAAFKPNAAFFELYGAPGWAALAEVIAAIPPEVPVILDAKRGDIASTAQAYARSVYEGLGAGAVTLSPYLGYDSLAPFLEYEGRGVFLLCKTSNPGSADLQDLEVCPVEGEEDGRMTRSAGQPLYLAVAAAARRWNRLGNLGLVVGATHPQALSAVRSVAPELWILAPGVGAQGGDLAAALAAGLRQDGLGLLVPVSRSLARAENPQVAAERLRQQINSARQASSRGDQKPVASPLPAGLRPLADGLLRAGCVRFGIFRLKSGLHSPIYLDLRQLVSHPRLLAQVARAYLPLLEGLQFDRLAALPYAALPIGTAIGLLAGWPLIYPRKESKAYGTQAEIEGACQEGERVVVVDDLATTGGSKFEAIEKLLAAGLQVQDVVVLIDRQSGAVEALAEAGYTLHAVFRLTELLAHWEHNRQVAPDLLAATRAFLESNTAS